jgi:signal transduction histidine kinase
MRVEYVSLGLGVVAVAALAAGTVLLARAQPIGGWTGLEVAWAVAAGIAAVAVVGQFVVVTLHQQRTAERLDRLREAALEAGGGNVDTKILDDGADEIGALSRAIASMATRVSRLFQAQRDLLAGVSHELRSPLARIVVALELLDVEVRALKGPEAIEADEEHELAVAIREEVELLEQHITRLLEAQRVSSQGVLLHREPIGLDALLERVGERDRARLEQLGFRLDLDLGLGDARIPGDANALDRLVSTLIENAIRHASDARDAAGAPTQPEFRIESMVDRLGVRLRFMDRGPGLTVEECAHVFEPFYRLDKSRNTETGGTGLGMYLVRQIAEAHRGSASAHPRRGGGLVVEVRLPLGDERGQQETVRVRLDAQVAARAQPANTDEMRATGLASGDLDTPAADEETADPASASG